MFRYDPNTLTLVTAKFNDSDDFVSKAELDKAIVQFGSFDNGDAHSAYLVFHVNPNVAVGEPIRADVRYTWTSTAAKGPYGFAVNTVIGCERGHGYRRFDHACQRSGWHRPRAGCIQPGASWP